jgi:hypothetical protein
MKEPNKYRFPPDETPNDAPSSHRLGLWAKCGVTVLGLLPSVLLLLIYAAVSFQKMWILSFGKMWPYLSLLPDVEFDSTKYKFPVFFLSTVCFPVATPLLLLPWSYFLLKVTEGTLSAMPLGRRTRRVIGPIIKMSLLNYLIGAIALLVTIAFYVWRNGVPLPIVR